MAKQDIRISINQIERLLMFDYDAGSEGALFDICDASGRIVKTGEVAGHRTRVRLTDLDGQEFVLMVLDGEVSSVKPFHLRKVA